MERITHPDKRHLNPLHVLAVAWLFVTLILMSSHNTAFAQEKAIESLKETGKAFAAVSKEVSPAVVFIRVEKSVTSNIQTLRPFNDEFFRRFFGEPSPGPNPQQPQQPLPPQQQKRIVQGQGSGFIISQDGFILTNNHVVGDADKVIVKLLDGRELTAKTIGTDPPTDVAVIKIDAKNLPVLPIGDSDKLEVGEWVLALGNPFGLSHSLTAGIVSAKGRSRMGIADYEDFIQTDAAINPGNSGGPLINLEGRAVGINTAIFSQTGGSMGIGFAIPINMARSIYTQLIEHGSVERGYLGVTVQDLTSELAKTFNLDKAGGVLISQVMPDTPAEKAGLKQGDIIVKLNNESVEAVAPFRNRISQTRPGTKIDLEVIREGKKKTFEVKIEKLVPKQETAQAKTPEAVEKLGITVSAVTKEIADQFDMKEGKGVVVTKVDPESAAARSGIRPGIIIVEVDRKEIKSVKDFETVVGKKSKKPFLLLIKDQQGSHFIAIDPE